MTAKPTFRELTRTECEEVLARGNIGRIAFSYRDHVDIEPIHYVMQDQWIYGRTTSGTKLRTLAHNRWLAFEVDEVQALFDWKSVVVKGALYLLELNGSSSETYNLALVAIRTLIPEALDVDDPTPDRRVLFRIHVDQMTGRAATTGA
jgi:nitroimidazol reductase NimA-like FMN-containing flavoprotein (pyridoxamine 5'-phosphate oxidase superfamily)